MRRPNVNKFGRETMQLVDSLAAFELAWRITGSGHLQPLRVTGISLPGEPIVDAAGRPIVSSLSPSSERAARDNFLRSLRRVGVIRDHRPNGGKKPKTRERSDHPRIVAAEAARDELQQRNERRALLDIIGSAPIETLRELALASHRAAAA